MGAVVSVNLLLMFIGSSSRYSQACSRTTCCCGRSYRRSRLASIL